jgi:predicted component of type VI protein secretion system
MKLRSQYIELVTIEKPLAPYILLEKICRDTKSITSATLIQFLPGETVKIGRGHTCDLRISDISVSRFHSKIMYDKGQFKIYDNNSKFGTLILLQEPFKITEQKVAVQVGRTVVTVALRKEKLEKQIRSLGELGELDTGERASGAIKTKTMPRRKNPDIQFTSVLPYPPQNSATGPFPGAMIQPVMHGANLASGIAPSQAQMNITMPVFAPNSSSGLQGNVSFQGIGGMTLVAPRRMTETSAMPKSSPGQANPANNASGPNRVANSTLRNSQGFPKK